VRYRLPDSTTGMKWNLKGFPSTTGQSKMQRNSTPGVAQKNFVGS